jgi:hypothetical protein
MFQGLKIAIYNIKISFPKIPKIALDYNLYILLIVAGLNYFLVL